jgi:hypothetical protein
MKSALGRQLAGFVQRFFGIHPDVIRLIGGGFRLTNPSNANFPSENLPLASRVIASGMWNYCFFQFYRNFAGPYWVERQYNPRDDSFIPRAGSMMSLNLTHRTWCGFRGPNSSSFGMVDPAGSLSPVVGYYSIEIALEKGGTGQLYLPSRRELRTSQYLADDLPVPVTTYEKADAHIEWKVTGDPTDSGSILSLIDVRVAEDDWSLLISVRPFNPEGAALLDQIEYRSAPEFHSLMVNGREEIRLLDRPDDVHVSNLETGDAYYVRTGRDSASCPYGLATAVLRYRLQPGHRRLAFHARTYEQIVPAQVDPFDDMTSVEGTRKTEVRDFGKPRRKIRADFVLRKELPITDRYLTREVLVADFERSKQIWQEKLSHASQFQCARESWNRAAKIHTGFVLSLQTEKKVTPGVFTYRQFWFRDAAYMLSALSGWNLLKEARTVLETYPARQLKDGFFKSHEGEWDSNGQAIWTITDYYRKSGDRELLEDVFSSLVRGADWIVRHRKKGYARKLMPPGFSAEHLGPADHYHWDNLWSIAGLREAAYAARSLGGTKEKFVLPLEREERSYSEDFLLLTAPERQRYGLLTAAPNRGIDPGIIGSIVHIYPLELNLLPYEEVRNTVRTLYRLYFQNDLFFHPIIHSGFNIYLSLQVAQSFLRLGQLKTARRIFRRVLQMRTDLWTYPEAIHPRTGGGVMGDGFHGWASAELLHLLREFAVSERKTQKQSVIEIFRGVRGRELFDAPLRFGPFPMRGGHILIQGELTAKGGRLSVDLESVSMDAGDLLVIHLPYKHKKLTEKGRAADLSRLKVKGGSFELQDAVLIIHQPASHLEIEILKA